jgi:uncharacterized protein YqjF (DUF2071 family)
MFDHCLRPSDEAMTLIANPPHHAARMAARLPNGRCRQVMHQRWESLLFLHWRVSPELIQQTLPAGLTVDTFNGRAYLGIVPFFMLNVRPIGLPSVPRISFFQELNVRTYVYDEDRIPGVWFYSLDCNRIAATILARIFAGLPYFLAEMKATRATWIDYACRRFGSPRTARYQYRPAGPDREAEPGSLEFFLLERYYLFAYRRRSGSLRRGQVSHVPYRYRDVEIPELSTIPAELDGFTGLSESPDHVCVADGLDVKIFGQERVY